MEGNAAFIDGYLVHNKLSKDEAITFCIDTGAGSTCLFELEAIALGINVHKLRRGRDSHGVGGTVNTYLLENAKIKFLSDQHQWAVVSFGAIPVIAQRNNLVRRVIGILAKITPIGRKKLAGEERRGLPNLLGFDFLKDCKISFSATEAYLDI